MIKSDNGDNGSVISEDGRLMNGSASGNRKQRIEFWCFCARRGPAPTIRS